MLVKIFFCENFILKIVGWESLSKKKYRECPEHFTNPYSIVFFISVLFTFSAQKTYWKHFLQKQLCRADLQHRSFKKHKNKKIAEKLGKFEKTLIKWTPSLSSSPKLLNVFLVENFCYFFFSFVYWKLKNNIGYKIRVSIENIKTRIAFARIAERKLSNLFFCLNFVFDFLFFTELKANSSFLKIRSFKILAKTNACETIKFWITEQAYS